MILNYPTNEVLVKMSECDWWFWFCVARPGLLTISISMSSAQFLAHCDRTSVQLFSSSVSDSPQNIFWIFWPGAAWDGSRASSSNQHTKREVVFRVTKLTSWSQISLWQSSWCFWGLFGSCCSFWHVDDHLQCIVVFPVSCVCCCVCVLCLYVVVVFSII